MNNEDLVLKMILDESGFSAGMDKAVKQLGKFDGQVENTSQRGGRSLGGIWTSFVGNFLASGATKIISTGIGMITSSVDSAINRVDTLNNSNRVFENMGFSAKETASTMDALKLSINGLPTALDSAIQGVQLIASSTNDLGKSEKIFTALNNGILGFGGNAEMVNNAVVQLSQSFSNGKVDAQTWNSMINSGLGPALNALAKQMGLTAGQLKEGLSEGTISVETFQDALIDLNKNGGGGLKSLEQIAKDSTSGIKTGIANMKTAVVRGVANIITSFDEGLKGAGFDSISVIIADMGSKFESGLNKMAQAIPPLMKDLKGLYDKIEPFAPLILSLVGVIGTFTAVLKVQQVVTGVSDAFKKWKTTTEGVTIAQKILNSTLLANPIALIVTAVITLTATIFYLWKTNEGFRNAVVKIWEDVKQAITNAAEGAKKAWESTKKFFSDMWNGFKKDSKEAVENVKNAWSGTKQWFSNMWNGVKQSTSDKWNEIKEMFAPYVEMMIAPFRPMVDFFIGLWDNVKSIAGSYWELIKTAIMGPVLLLIDLITLDFTQFKEDLVMLWTNIKDHASNIFNNLKEIMINLVTATVDTLKARWENLKVLTINAWNVTVDAAKLIWNSFKDWIKTTIKNIVDGVVRDWESLKKWTVDIFNKTVDGAKRAWEDLKQSVRDVVDKVTGTFDEIAKIDLFEAGKAIIEGFIKGLKQKWEDGKKFVSGIGDWIRDNKGPIEYDRKLLVNNGMAIMDGLNKGIRSGFEFVKKTVRGAAGELNNEFNSNLDNPNIQISRKASVFSNEGQLTTKKQESSVTQKQGDTYNINLQALGELSDVELMKLGEKLMKILKELKDREDAPKGGPVYGI